MPRRILEGKVVSAKNDKSVTVLVERRFMHPVYKKYVKKSSKYSAHDEINHYKEGDDIAIIECSPISKTKRFVVMIDGKAGLRSSADTAEKAVKKAEAKKPAAKKAPAKKAAPKKTAEKKAAPKKETAKKPAAKKAPAKKTAAKKKDDK